MQGRNPINAMVSTRADGGPHIQVYWRNFQGDIVASHHAGSWGAPTKVIGGIESGFRFTVLQWGSGKIYRVYYHTRGSVVREHCSNDGGETWFPGWQGGGILSGEP